MTNKTTDTLTRLELAKKLQSELGTVTESTRFVTAFFDTLKQEIVRNEAVKVHGFGVFRCLNKKERVGRNLKTGETALISSRRVVSFVAGSRFRAMVQKDEDA